MKPILAPHKEQDGFVYTRMPSGIAKPDAPARFDVPRPLVCTALITKGGEVLIEHHYDDSEPGSRIISSRRVEEAVETADFLKLCADEGLCAVAVNTGTWVVGKRTRLVGTSTATGLASQMTFEPYQVGETLRAAYYRYHAAAGDAK